MDYLLIRGSDQSKYGTFKKGLKSKFSLGKYQYPKTILMAVDTLNIHKFYMKHYERQKQNQDRGRPEQNEKTLRQVLYIKL